MNSIEEYCINHSNQESSILKELTQFTYATEKAPQMISGALVSNFLSLLIKAINPQKILEVGMFTGYSALNIAEHTRDSAEIHTCELMEEHIETAKSFFKKSKHGHKIFIHQGLAIDTLENFKINSFDFGFIDADKINYLKYYKRCIHLIKSKGILVLDNMLWGGSVLDPKDDDSKKLREVGDYIQTDSRVHNALFPIRDGLMVCIKK
tara:strand:- start:2250 stop:2873 length:624 start_codon:yes stop_codon:yes gene_type:complete